MSFGGKAWPISTEDMNLGPVQRGSSMCIGGIFDLTQGIATGPGNPNWVVGDVFLASIVWLGLCIVPISEYAPRKMSILYFGRSPCRWDLHS
jgi:hypothetical protein